MVFDPIVHVEIESSRDRLLSFKMKSRGFYQRGGAARNDLAGTVLSASSADDATRPEVQPRASDRLILAVEALAGLNWVV